MQFIEGRQTPTLDGKSPSTPIPRRTRQRTISASSSFKGSSTTASAQPILRNRTRTIYTAGRPPWYDSAGQHMKPCVIGRFFCTMVLFADQLISIVMYVIWNVYAIQKESLEALQVEKQL